MTTNARKLLEPYLAGDAERPNGDMDFHCPIHGDARRSATVNFDKGVWYCNACEEGGTIKQLVGRQSEWLPVPGELSSNGNGSVEPLPDRARIDGWESALSGDESAREYLEGKRGFDPSTISAHGVGWNGRRYTFPVYDEKGILQNVRYYSPTAEPKWINHQGFGSPPRLYPASVFLDDPEVLVIAEGEFDTLIANQHGVPAVTSTGGAKSMGRWRAEWSEAMRGRTVYICFDCDAEGRQSAKKAVARLKGIPKRLRVIELPYPMGSKKDLSDWFLEGGTAEDLYKLAKTDIKPRRVTYREVAYDALRSGKMEGRPVIMEATVAGINSTQLLIPTALKGKCNYDWDPKRCATCPMMDHGGNMTVDTKNNHKLRLELLGLGSDKAREKLFRETMKVPANCPKLEIIPEHKTYWDCEVRNGSNLSEEAYPMLLGHDAIPPALNSLYKFSGRVRPSPRGQKVIFDADACTPARQDLDTFVPDSKDVEKAVAWIDSFEGTPDEKLEGIAELLERHVTRIYGQRNLHLAMDLVYHSVLAFRFGGAEPARGWMEVLAVGETRSGKSTTAKRLRQLYDRGHYEAVENASIAGLLYGAEKRQSGVWQASIGVLPLNDRGLVTLDEAQGMSKEMIGQMSAMRSDGEVKITKIRQATCNARVRLIWLANGRKKRYPTGLDALQDLMGQPEDLARVDIPLYVLEDIGDELLHAREDQPELPESVRGILRWIVLWAWSRSSDHVRFSPTATEATWDLGENLAEQYAVKDSPVFTRNEASIRLARVAVALAARLFSSPNGTTLSVKTEHVLAAYNLCDRFLGAPELELKDIKQEELDAAAAGKTNVDDLLRLFESAPREFALKVSAGTVDERDFRTDWGGNAIGQLIGFKGTQGNRGDGAYLVTPWAQKLAKEYIRR